MNEVYKQWHWEWKTIFFYRETRLPIWWRHRSISRFFLQLLFIFLLCVLPTQIAGSGRSVWFVNPSIDLSHQRRITLSIMNLLPKSTQDRTSGFCGQPIPVFISRPSTSSALWRRQIRPFCVLPTFVLKKKSQQLAGCGGDLRPAFYTMSKIEEITKWIKLDLREGGSECVWK